VNFGAARIFFAAALLCAPTLDAAGKSSPAMSRLLFG